jgi:hypothetical protein
LAIALPGPQSASVLRCLESREGDAACRRVAEACGGEEDDADVAGGRRGVVEESGEEFAYEKSVREVVGAELDLVAVGCGGW